MEFDRDYFTRYVDSGTHYSRVFKIYSSIEACVKLFKDEQAPKIRSMCVLGAATGKVHEYIHSELGMLAYGCEISSWAHAQIGEQYKKRVALEDMRTYIDHCPEVDLIFSNSLMYLEPDEVLPFLEKCRKRCKYFHFEGSYWGNACRDPHRKTLKTKAWWADQFKSAQFEEVTTMWGKPTYLWK